MDFFLKLRISLILAMVFFATTGYSQSPPGSGWTSVFADEFGGTQINTNIWLVKNPSILGMEKAFLPARVKVSGGTLKIENRFFNNENGGVPQGGWIQSKEEFAKPGRPKYGYYEARLRIVGPDNGKIWPAWWIWGNRKNGVVTTEFDLMEYSGSSKVWFNNKATTSHHSIGKQKIFPAQWNPNILLSDHTTQGGNASMRNVFGGWHVWGMHWTPTSVTFYYDGEPYFETPAVGASDAANENLGLKLILSSSPHTKDVEFNNFGPGGFQPNNPSTTPAQPGDNLGTLEVDWVRVWEGGNINGSGGGGTSNVGPLANIANGTYYIKKASSNNYLKAAGAASNAVSTNTNGSNDTKWTFTKLANGEYEIKSVAYANSRLEVPNGASGPSTAVATTTWNGNAAHLVWVARSVGNDIMFFPKHDQNNALDLWSSNPSVVHLYNISTGNANQRFQLIPASGGGNTGGGNNGGAPVGSLIAFKPIQASWINRGGQPPLGYISARFDDGGLVKSSAATSPPTQAWQAWERFTVESHNNGGIAISVQSPGGKRYFQHSGTGSINANATAKTGNNTKFTWESLGGNNFALKTAGGNYVQVPQNAAGNPVLNSSAGALGDWEKLTFTTFSGSASARTNGTETTSSVDLFDEIDEPVAELKTEFSLYPNPAINELTIRGVAQNKLIQVLDLNGRVLYKLRANGLSTTLPISEMKPGLYLIRVDGHQTRRFIKR